jgi:signal transduction histidine kinase
MTRTKTILTVSTNSKGGHEAGTALRNAGIGVLEIGDWRAAAKAMRDGEASLVVCDSEAFSAFAADAQGKSADPGALPSELARTISHELRTPLSAMAGWLHLMESGKLDEAGYRRAIDKLRGNIDDQVRTIERYLGATQEGTR